MDEIRRFKLGSIHRYCTIFTYSTLHEITVFLQIAGEIVSPLNGPDATVAREACENRLVRFIDGLYNSPEERGNTESVTAFVYSL